MKTPTRSPRAKAALAGAAITTAAILCTAMPATAEPPADRGPQHHVIYFAMDGFDADYLDGRAPLPNIQKLAKRGVLTSATGVMSSMTNQSWASVASGAHPDVTLNDSYVLNAAGVVQGQTRRNVAETLAESLVRDGKTMASIQFFMFHNRGAVYGDPDRLYTQPGGDCDVRADQTISILRGEPVDSNGEMVTVSEIPDFITMYCSDIDGVGHNTGEYSQETLDALVHVDEQIGRVVEETKRAGIYGRTTFILSGDHGITTYQQVNGPEVEAAIDALGYEAEWVSTGRAPSPGTEVALAGGGLTSIHLLGELRGDAAVAEEIRQALQRVEGVGDVFDKQQQAEMRMAPTYGELVAEPAPGWAMFIGNQPYDRGRHGTTQDLDVAFLISGSGVRPGRSLQDPQLIDIAPTIARLLGAPAPADSEGRVLAEALIPPRR